MLDHKSGRVEISSQNHGFAIEADAISDPDVVILHVNFDDESVEGLEHKELAMC